MVGSIPYRDIYALQLQPKIILSKHQLQSPDRLAKSLILQFPFDNVCCAKQLRLSSILYSNILHSRKTMKSS